MPTKVCICQICTCGRHRCPHHPTAVVTKSSSPCLLTEYATRYKQHPLQPTQSFKPEPQPHEDSGPLEDRTTNRVDYIAHPYSKPPIREAESYKQPEGDFDHTTNYKKDYPKRPLQANRIVKRDAKRATPGRFSGEPTYVTDFRKWPIAPRERHGAENTYRPNTAPFQGSSNYTNDYRGPVAPPRQSMKPVETNRQSNQPFDGNTGYRDDFIKHPMPPREKREAAKYEPNKAPLDGLSHYMKDYQPKAITGTTSFKPENGAYQSDAPFHDATTQRTDYQKWPTMRPNFRQPDVYVKPEGEMNMNVTSHTDYNKKPIQRVAPVKPSDRKGAPGKFNGVTNYHTDFRKWTPQARVQPKNQAGGYMPPQAPFEGLSNYHDDYRRHSAVPRQSMKPTEAAKMSDQPFDGTTGYREEFIKHPLEARQQKERPAWQPNQAKLDDISNYRKDYIEKKPEKVTSFKPDGGAYVSDAPFHGDTTQRVDYQKWPTERPSLREPDVYVKPEGDFDFGTTHKTNYTKKPLERVTIHRPPPAKREPGKFQGSTNYSTDFRKWGLTGRTMPKEREQYVPNQAPFEGVSSYQDEYFKKNGVVRQSLKPAEKALGSEVPFDGHTMYRSDYTAKDVPPCPAFLIQAGKDSGFVFTGQQDLAGHKYYQPQSEGVRVPSPPKMANGNVSAQACA